MNRLFVSLAALFALVAAPLAAEPLAVGEIELKIEALGDTPADTAIIPIQLVGRGATEALAKADLAKKEKDFYAALTKLGIPRSKVEAAKEDEPRYPVIEAAAYGCAEAAVAAVDAAADEPAPTVIAPGCPKPEMRESLLLFVTVEDLTKIPELSEFAGDDYYSRSQGTFYSRDPKAAHTAAVAEAIANARAEAETYAAAMGYRVVRMVRVGNAKPKVNWPDLMMLFGGIYSGMGAGSSESAALYELRAMAAGHYAGVTIDFVLAPK
jgi:uncharacterized protein